MANEYVEYNANQRVPTDRDLMAALLVAIGTHPLVQQAEVYNPADPIDSRAPIKISKFRLYGGKELISERLTLSLYPATHNIGNSPGGRQAYLTSQPQGLGPGNAEGSSDTFLTKFHLQLSYRVADFDTAHSISYYALPGAKDAWAPTDELLYQPTKNIYSKQYQSWPELYNFDVVVLPAEEVLKEWITILRYVIRDIRSLKPYQVRNPQISGVSYDSSGIFDKESVEALVFHRATIQFELRYSEGNFDR